MIPIWLEVHIDAAAMERGLLTARGSRASAYGAIADALEDIASRAEEAGARLSFRAREGFALHDVRPDARGVLRRLVAAGHEVGWHAHGARLKAARDAVVAAGGDAALATPGLVQRPDLALLNEARSLGARIVTDRVEANVFAYQGWLAWEPLPGMVRMDVSVSPLEWGVLVRRGRKLVPGRLEPDVLARRISAWDARVVPPGATAFFGATFHDHDILDPAARDALGRLFARYGERIVPSGQVGRTFRPPEGPAAPAGRLSRLSRGLLRLRLGVERSGAPSAEHVIEVGGRFVPVRRVGPANPDVVLVIVHGGDSGVAQGLRPFGLSEAALAESNMAAWTFARSEGARPPGSIESVEETRAVLVRALGEGRPVALLTWSAGVIPALRAANALGDPRVCLLVDGEGPCDRWSLVPPNQPDNPLARIDPGDERSWAGKEAVAMLPAFNGRYIRLQAEDDHVHGKMWWHARRMLAAARDGRLNGDGRILPGRLDAYGDGVLEWITRAI
jgi:hypothetical protein